MGLLDWILGKRGGDSAAEARAVESIERVLQLTNPRLKFARRYKARLLPAMTAAIEHAGSMVGDSLPERVASAAAWAADPYLRAFFATADDLKRAFSRSRELQAFFQKNPAAREVSVVLSMLLVERRVLGVALEGTELRRDVPQTTVSFTDYRARICGPTESELRQDLERRIVDQLALTGMAKAAQDESQRAVFEQERALLRARLRMLESQGAGLTALVGKEQAEAGQYERLQTELAINEGNLKALAAGAEALDFQLERIREVLASPQEHFFLTSRRLRLNRMNIVLADDDPQPGETLDLRIARVPVPNAEAEMRTYMLVRFPVSDLLPPGSLLDDAARMLG